MQTRNYRCRVAADAHDIIAAQTLRYRVFAVERGYLTSSPNAGTRDHDPWDMLETAVHVLVETDGELVGTARLVFGRRRLGCTLGFGIPLETSFNLSSLPSEIRDIVQVGRLCVAAEHRRAGAAQVLYRALAEESIQQGISVWVGAANCETDSAHEAQRIQAVVSARGLWSNYGFSLRGRMENEDGLPATRRLSTSVDGLPAVLESFVRYGGVRFCAPPIYDLHFQRYAIPFIGSPLVPLRMAAPRNDWSRHDYC